MELLTDFLFTLGCAALTLGVGILTSLGGGLICGGLLCLGTAVLLEVARK